MRWWDIAKVCSCHFFNRGKQEEEKVEIWE